MLCPLPRTLPLCFAVLSYFPHLFCPLQSWQFVKANVVHAYCSHHNLVICPDDVWLAILFQFGSYINANAEALRSLLVAHEGKKQLIVYQAASLRIADYVSLAHDTVFELRANIIDPLYVIGFFLTSRHYHLY
ncbi:hypothetical protein L7F22_066880 [Adiantum nelumboides]|nr:hypothetical protein [Adiantum nelumboides]